MHSDISTAIQLPLLAPALLILNPLLDSILHSVFLLKFLSSQKALQSSRLLGNLLLSLLIFLKVLLELALSPAVLYLEAIFSEHSWLLLLLVLKHLLLQNHELLLLIFPILHLLPSACFLYGFLKYSISLSCLEQKLEFPCQTFQDALVLGLLHWAC